MKTLELCGNGGPAAGYAADENFAAKIDSVNEPLPLRLEIRNSQPAIDPPCRSAL